MTRTKTRTDEQVLDSALELLQESGVAGLTFAALAGRSGLSAATLVQRFTNKATLTQRALLHGWDRLDELTRDLASTAPHTPDGAITLLVGLSGQYEGVNSYSEGLLMLREDFRDPVLRRRGVAWEAELTAALQTRFEEVARAPVGIGYALAAFWQGSLTWWAFRADEPVADYLTDKLTEFLRMFHPNPAH